MTGFSEKTSIAFRVPMVTNPLKRSESPMERPIRPLRTSMMKSWVPTPAGRGEPLRIQRVRAKRTVPRTVLKAFVATGVEIFPALVKMIEVADQMIAAPIAASSPVGIPMKRIVIDPSRYRIRVSVFVLIFRLTGRSMERMIETYV